MTSVQVGGQTLTVMPLLRCSDGLRTLPDRTAIVNTATDGVTATWPDGLILQLTVHPAGRGASIQTTVRGNVPTELHEIGFRIVDFDADRLLIDGYHSWDWAGLRSLLAPGAGWWGAIAGSPGRPRVAIHLDEPPRYGALRLAWEGDGSLDVVTAGEPAQLTTRTGPPTTLVAGTVRSDWVRIAPLITATFAGAGLPPLPLRAHKPGRRRVGWMSWNCVGSAVTAANVVDARRLVPSGEILVLDDGWMRRWGDWVERDDFDGTLSDLVRTLHMSAHSLGLWLAPFMVDPASDQ